MNIWLSIVTFFKWTDDKSMGSIGSNFFENFEAAFKNVLVFTKIAIVMMIVFRLQF